MKTLLELLKPPVFEDEEKNIRASILHPILLGLIPVYLAFTIFTVSSGLKSQAYILQFAGVAILLSLYLVRKGKFGITGYIIPSVLLLSMTVFVYNGNGIHDVAMLGFPITIALSGLLIGKFAAIYSGLGSIACVAFIIWLEITNRLVTGYQNLTDPGDLFIIGVFLAAMATVVYGTMNIIEKNFSELKQLNSELEERVTSRTLLLEAINKDLESFSYSISHDLRAPLRSIDGYSRILQNDFSENMDETARGYIERISEGASQMNTLIDEILAFSRTGRQALKPEYISAENLEEMIRAIIAGLGMQEPERQVEFSVKELRGCCADYVLLKQVFVNLLSNAYKFTRHRQPAKIEVGCLNHNGSRQYYIRDNGIGFDMAYADKLFGVFQRLVREQDYEGTGVGLAIVHRIITRHNGRIWAEAAHDQGATFFFTISMDTPGS
jgi:signal transduction histidine kinase